MTKPVMAWAVRSIATGRYGICIPTGMTVLYRTRQEADDNRTDDYTTEPVIVADARYYRVVRKASKRKATKRKGKR